MTKEFENLLELLKSTDKGTFFLGLQVAKNFKKEFLAYFGRSVVEVRKIQEENIKLDIKDPYAHPKIDTYFECFVQHLHWTFEDFAENLGLFNPKLPENMQCGGYYRLKKMFLEKQTLKQGDLQFLHPVSRKYVFNGWNYFLKFRQPKDKTITILPEDDYFIEDFDDI